jgi:hypothetical protein
VLCCVVLCCVVLCFVVFCCVLLCFVVFCCVLLFIGEEKHVSTDTFLSYGLHMTTRLCH